MIDEWSPDPDVDCSVPDLQWVVWTALGALVIVAALVVAAVQKLRKS